MYELKLEKQKEVFKSNPSDEQWIDYFELRIPIIIGIRNSKIGFLKESLTVLNMISGHRYRKKDYYLLKTSSVQSNHHGVVKSKLTTGTLNKTGFLLHVSNELRCFTTM